MPPDLKEKLVLNKDCELLKTAAHHFFEFYSIIRKSQDKIKKNLSFFYVLFKILKYKRFK